MKKIIRTILDEYKPYSYNILCSRSNIKTLNLLGARIGNNVQLSNLKIYDPRLVEIANKTLVKNVKIIGNHYLLVLPHSKAIDMTINSHTIVSPKKIYIGKELSKESITLSFDLEGGVGLSHASKEEFEKLKAYWNSKQSARRLSNILAKYEIKSTWAACGHLFLKECNGKHGFSLNDYYGDWFSLDPKSNYKNDSSWYMPDLLDEMKNNSLIEIGYHSFGHFKYQKIDQASAEKDMQIMKQIEKDYNIKIKSFVFPYNSINHIETLTKYGIKFMRGYINGTNPLGKIINFNDFLYVDTNMSITPNNIKDSITRLKKSGNINLNIFTHPWNWQKEGDFKKFEEFIKFLLDYKQYIIKFCEV